MKPVNVGIIGFGTIGAGTAGLLLEHADLIERRLGFPLSLARVADLDIASPRPVTLPPGVLTKDAKEIIADPSIDIVVELIGGLEPARTLILSALAAGKSVVTANKALLAEHGAEIFRSAASLGRDLGFEASVAGGIPVLRALREGLSGERIRAIYGIINGTSNFILSSMSQSKAPFEEMLKEAQRLGYAEADPTLDIEGIDTAHKIAILASIAFNRLIPFETVSVEGITRILPIDLEYAAEFGYTVKLLGIAKETPRGVQIRVHPTMIPSDSLLAKVNDVFNAVVIQADHLGSVLMTGRGAGAQPTATAVVGDIVDIARNLRRGKPGRVPPLMAPDPAGGGPIDPIEELSCPFYFRLFAVDKPGVLSLIAGIFGNNGISIESVIQRGRSLHGGVPILLMTHAAVESNVRKAIGEMDGLDAVVGSVYAIKVENDL